MISEVVKLDEVLKYEQPTKYIVDTINYDESFPIPVLTAGKSFILGYTDEVNGVFDDLPVIIFDDFTTAFHYVDFPFKVKSSAMKILKPIKDKADLKFLFYKMQTISMDTDLHKRYWISKYSQVQIPLPPLPQQQKIAKILDAADALRQKDKALLTKYNELTKALFLDMFGDPVSNPKGWEKVNLGDICTKITDGTHQGPKFTASGVPFLLVSNIVNNELNFNVKKYVSEDEYLVLTKSTAIEKGDILYTSVGSYGNPAIVKDTRKFCFQRHIAHLKPKHDIVNVIFLHAMMASPMVKRQADSYAIGVAQKTLNLKVIKLFTIYLPDMEIQNQFAERVQTIEHQKTIAQKSLEKSEQLFNSLLQKAFKGELV